MIWPGPTARSLCARRRSDRSAIMPRSGAPCKTTICKSSRPITARSCSMGRKPFEYEGVPYQRPGKELGRENFTKIPNGLPGLGDRMIILWSEGVAKGQLTANRFVEITATNPAKVFGMYPRKGTIAVGSDADLLIWDPRSKRRMAWAHRISAWITACLKAGKPRAGPSRSCAAANC